MAFPLEMAFKFSNDNSILGCVGNLCRSSCRRASASSFYGFPSYYSCCNSLFGNYQSPSFDCLVTSIGLYPSSFKFGRHIESSSFSKGDKIVRVSPSNPKATSGSYGTGFMKKSTKFIVSNDLTITPMSSSSTIGLLKNLQIDFSNLEKHHLSISKAELISILRATLMSSSALTKGLSYLLVKKPKQET